MEHALLALKIPRGLVSMGTMGALTLLNNLRKKVILSTVGKNIRDMETFH
jgi:hypothetical protein